MLLQGKLEPTQAAGIAEAELLSLTARFGLAKRMRYMVLALLWIAWCVLHSAMISLRVTGYLKRRLARGFRFYRLAFNVVALATVTPIVLYERSIDTEWAFWWQGPVVVLQALLLTGAFLCFFAGAMHYDFSQFLGIRQIRDGVSTGSLAESGELNTTGILGVIRHPWYAGAIMLVWARGLTGATLITNIMLTVYLIVGTYLEERKLIVQYGDKYRSYQQKVPMFIPYGVRKSKTRKGQRGEGV